MSQERQPSPTDTILRDFLTRAVELHPDRTAFTHECDRISFEELFAHASSRASALEAMGVRSQHRVAIAMSAGIPLVEVFWAAQLIGAVPCVFNPFVPAETLLRRIGLARPTAIVSDETAAAMSLDRAHSREAEIGSEDCAFLQLTSGTTGAPRLSMVRHRNVLAETVTGSGSTLLPDDVLVDWAPPWHDLGLVRFVIHSVCKCLTCHLVTPAISAIPKWLETVSEQGATVTGAPDFAYLLATRLVDPATVDLSSLRFCTSGGEPVRWSSIEQFEQRFAIPGVVMPGYGLGEATLAVTTCWPGETIAVDERGNVSCGRPFPGTEVRAGSSVAQPDEILVRGDSVFAGYFEAPEETAETLQDGWLHTGDIGYLDAESRLFVLGRRSGMIKRAGALIAPRELEEAALQVDGVRIAAAISLPDPARGDGETIAVAIEAKVSAERSESQITSDVSRAIVASLGFAPGWVTLVPPRTIPRTENGKIRHQEMAEVLLRVGMARLEMGSTPT